MTAALWYFRLKTNNMVKYYHKKSVNIPLYKGNLIIILSNDEDRLKKEFPDNWEKDDFVFFYYKDDYHYYLIFNFHKADRNISHSNIAHESLHAANVILDSRGVVSDFNNDEPVTYLLEWIINQVYKFARDKKMKIEYAD